MLSKFIAKRIKELRLDRGWTQEVLAEASNLDESYIGKIERQVYDNLTVKTLEKIIIGLDVEFKEFFQFSQEDVTSLKLSTLISSDDDTQQLLEIMNLIIKYKHSS
jgi:putative HTH-type transcriptional regulator yazB